MRLFCKLVFTLALASSPGFAQNSLTIQAPAPNPVAFASATITGNQGNGTYYYWVVANYPTGAAFPTGPTVAQFAPSPLTGSNFVTISWAPIGATTYDVIESNTPTFPVPCSACKVGTTSGSSVLDNGGSHTSYTVAPAGAAQLTMTLNNTSDTQPYVNANLINNIVNLNYRLGFVLNTAVVGHCVQFGVALTLTDAGQACGSGGGSTAFSAITNGTNTAATMNVGTGASLQPTGLGLLVANSVPASAGATSSANAQLGYDTTNNNFHLGINAQDAIAVATKITPANNDCPKWVVSGGNLLLGTTGAPCSAGGSTAFSGITAGTNTAALLMGSSGTLGRTGTGIIDANQINSATVPVSAPATATNASSQIIPAATTGTGSTLALSVSPAFTGNPTSPTQTQNDNSTKLATTAYTDLAIANAIAGVNPAVAVQAATITALSNTPTYSNGASGIGATLTAGSAAALVVDGYTLVLLDRILVKNQASTFQNGVYFLSTLGTGVIPYILTRALDFDQPSDINNTGAIPVINGTVNGTTQWVVTSKVVTMGTDAITFAQFSGNPANQLTGTPTNHGVGVGSATQAVNFTASGAVGTFLGGNGPSADPTFQAIPGAITFGQGTFASLPSCTTILNEIYYFTDSIYQQANCLAGASVWTYFHGGRAVTPPAGFTSITTTNITTSTTNGGIGFIGTGSTTYTSEIAYPSGSFTRVFAIKTVGLSTQFIGFGIYARNSSGDAGREMQMEIAFNGTIANTPVFYLTSCTAMSTGSGCGSNALPSASTWAGPEVWFKYTDDGTATRTWSYSVDGIFWIQVLSEGRTVGTTPNKLGIIVNSSTASVPLEGWFFHYDAQ